MSDFTAMASSLTQAQVSQQIDMAVAGKALDAFKAEGEAALSLLEDAAQLGRQLSASPKHLGRLIDKIA